ncbi:geranylgeranyl diphosphate reductase [Halanaeroarchaeum sulfurireducens]|uniref:Geranylgeranyl diphosphate reductase n=2 Tax=Halanaeroarchaeum sulfurireducens TaxID=1604004 RepID=A0A0F7PAE8_9EURY|nr:geranylgeranyl diphosphate reductase [Halanaeroarchaeum sulfurireducens]
MRHRENMQRVDVAIVGGGPAGTSAAIAAAERGADAIVIEKGVPRSDRDRLGPDSTDAAGFLDYWVDIADIDVEALPEDVILREIDGADFVGPNEHVAIDRTGLPSSYDGFGFTFDRTRLDDHLRDRAEQMGAEYRVGTAVRSVETDLTGTPEHTLRLADGSEIVSSQLILADGPQRQVTIPVLDQYLPADRQASSVMNPRSANHIAYQEYREFPEEVFDPSRLSFWWGWMPGETAYPWIFPNAGSVARIGLTMPIGMDIGDVSDRDAYRLLKPEDERFPTGRVLVRRMLDELYGDEYDVETDFPVLESGHGKSDGTETYPISSTKPIDSPTDANIAVVGGAMGTTSAFHEGGDHVAIRTGKIAGRLAATDSLDRYNRSWKEAIGEEVRRNVAMASIVEAYTPADWDHVFRTVRDILSYRDGGSMIDFSSVRTGFDALSLLTRYEWRRFLQRGDRCAMIQESTYSVR